MAWNTWKRCCKKVDSRSISQRSSLSWITTRNRMVRTKVQRVDELSQEDHTYKLTPGKEKIPRTMYLTLNKAGKNGPMKLRSDFRAAVSMKNRLHHESVEKVEEPIHPDQYRRWHPSSSTSWWNKSEWNWKWAHNSIFLIDEISFLLQLVSFTVDSDPLFPTGGVCRQRRLTRDFSHAPWTCDHTTLWLKVSQVRISLHPHAIHDVTCLSVRCLSLFCLPSLYLSPLPFLFHCLLVLWPAH